jgi:sugar/nucleoside kinase (ribokinase family)
MHDDRSAIAHAAADALERGRADGTLAATPALAGFDGFIDSIIRVVDRRRSMRMDDFDAIGTIPGFAGRVAAAAGKSANIELVVEEDRFGGNGPLYAGALGRLGMPTTYLGAVGRDDASPELLPIYEPFAARCEEVVPLAAPAHTDALEFEDGKIMLGKTAPVQAVTWERLVERVGLEGLRARCARSRLIGIVNWTLCGGVQGIWEGLINHVLPTLGEQGGEAAGPKAPRPEGMERRRRVFIDLSDPAKRTDADLRSALEVLRRMDELVPVTLGLNLAESERVARVLGVEAHADAPSLGESLRDGAERIRARSGFACIVIHPREGAAAAHRDGAGAWFEGPFTARPRLSTGAGDHFGAGFSFAQVLGLPLEQCLAVGCAVSGAYVRDAESPDLARLIGFLRDLPRAEQ